MSNLTVDDCEGMLTDSEAGLGGNGNYDNGENFVFTICIPDGDSIIMTFSSFCTELNFDSLVIHDGPNINAPVLGSYTGDPVLSPGRVPGTVVARSGCMTLHFTSDAAGVTCTGWEASWATIVREPSPPQFSPIPNPTCNSTSLTVTIDQQVHCDSVYQAAFTLSGPSTPSVISATPVGCSGDSTNTFQLGLAPDITESGIYTITFTSFFVDHCDSVWELTANGGFIVDDCPINADILFNTDTICPGDCAFLEGQGFGGDPATYQYTWSGGVPNGPGPHAVCPLVTTTYSLTISDATPAPAGTDTRTIVVRNRPTMPADFTMCRSDPNQTLVATPSGGYWQGPGLQGGDTLTGLFRAWRANAGTHTVTYYDPFGCTNTMQITVIDIEAGSYIAFCPGDTPVQLTGFRPAGGVWSGPSVTPGGLFDPFSAGSYSLTYTHPNGCSDVKTINVDSITVQADDTICTTGGRYRLTFSPLGIRWSGPGIVNSFWGDIDPTHSAITGPGTYTYIGRTQGSSCTDTVRITIRDVDAGPDAVACPLQGPVNLTGGTPGGGVWAGIGVADPVTGLYDPSLGGGDFDDQVTYTVNGCTAERMIYVRTTAITEDTLRFCELDPAIDLEDPIIDIIPGGGSWAGPGIITAGGPGTFDPATAGPGIHTLVYDANTCTDNLVVVVTPTPTLQNPPALCERSAPVNLVANPPGGIWLGPGITDSVNGTFDPSIVGTGDHDVIYFTLPDTCGNLFTITVDTLPVVSIAGLDINYCYRDNNIQLTGTPPGGVFNGPGVTGNSFNPVLAGTALNHPVTYTVGTGDCAVTSTVLVTVGAPLEVSVSFADTIICFNNNVNLFAEGEGGRGFGYQFTWDNGLSNSQFQTVNPISSTTYTVVLSDGCSDSVDTSISVTVQPEILVTSTTNSIVCYGQNGFAELEVRPADNYSFLWNTSTPQTDSMLSAPVGTDYTVTITNDRTGCAAEETVTLPGYERLKAFFSVNPGTEECISLRNPTFTLLDLSEGVDDGIWDFGDGSTQSYRYLINPEHTYTDTGRFTITLEVSNGNGTCTDSHSEEVCVDQEAILFAPTAFSPNNDGENDRFRVFGLGVEDFEIIIYNRWGEAVYTSRDISQSWDGTHKGEKSPMATYLYVVRYTGLKVNGTAIHKGQVTLIR